MVSLVSVHGRGSLFNMLQSKLIAYNITISWSHEQYIPHS